MKEKCEYYYRTFAREDEPAIIKLVKETFPDFLEGDFWVWKYRLNPDFDPSLVVVAEKDGQVVGCNHWLIRDFKLSKCLKLKASLGADIIVHPEHRRHGVGKALLRFFRTSEAFKKKGVILTYMFTNRDLGRRLYEPAVGYVAAPNSTTTYMKYLNCRRLKEKFQLINKVIRSRKELQRELKGLNMHILFRLRGAPVFSINLVSNQVDLVEGEFNGANVIIEGDFPLFSSVMEGERRTRDLIKALLSRKLSVKKGKNKIFKLVKVFKVFKFALSNND